MPRHRATVGSYGGEVLMSQVSLYPLLLEKNPTAGGGVTQKSIEFGPLVAKRLAPSLDAKAKD
jgi:hypothetical protein